jgi:hypothetical protein
MKSDLTNATEQNSVCIPAIAIARFLHLQWHRYAADSWVDPLVRFLPHPAFKVDNLGRAVVDRRLLFWPYEPIAGYRVAIIATLHA